MVEKQVDKLGDLSVFEKVAVKDDGKVASKVETTAVLKAFHWVLQLAFYTAVQMVDGMVLSSDADWVDEKVAEKAAASVVLLAA